MLNVTVDLKNYLCLYIEVEIEILIQIRVRNFTKSL